MSGVITIVDQKETPPEVIWIPRDDIRRVRLHSEVSRGNVLKVFVAGMWLAFELPYDELEREQRKEIYTDVTARIDTDVTWTRQRQDRTFDSDDEALAFQRAEKLERRSWLHGGGGGTERPPQRFYMYRWTWVRTEQRP